MKRLIENSDLRCCRCDAFGFKRRPAGRWAWCGCREVWIPDDIDPGDHRCREMRIDGVLYGVGLDSDI